jgi:hypothetical protein
VPEKSAERFEDSTFKFFVMFFIKHFKQCVNAHRQSYWFFGVATQIRDQSVKLRVVGNKYRQAKRTDCIYPRQKILQHARLEDLASCRCVIRLAHQKKNKVPASAKAAGGRKGIQLTGELEEILRKLKQSATCWHLDEKTESYTFDYFVDGATRREFPARHEALAALRRAYFAAQRASLAAAQLATLARALELAAGSSEGRMRALRVLPKRTPKGDAMRGNRSAALVEMRCDRKAAEPTTLALAVRGPGPARRRRAGGRAGAFFVRMPSFALRPKGFAVCRRGWRRCRRRRSASRG